MYRLFSIKSRTRYVKHQKVWYCQSACGMTRIHKLLIFSPLSRRRLMCYWNREEKRQLFSCVWFCRSNFFPFNTVYIYSFKLIKAKWFYVHCIGALFCATNTHITNNLSNVNLLQLQLFVSCALITGISFDLLLFLTGYHNLFHVFLPQSGIQTEITIFRWRAINLNLELAKVQHLAFN